jgi:hypothetical protein
MIFVDPKKRENIVSPLNSFWHVGIVKPRFIPTNVFAPKLGIDNNRNITPFGCYALNPGNISSEVPNDSRQKYHLIFLLLLLLLLHLK